MFFCDDFSFNIYAYYSSIRIHGAAVHLFSLLNVSQYECTNNAITNIIKICISLGQRFSNFRVHKESSGETAKKKKGSWGPPSEILIQQTSYQLLNDPDADCCADYTSSIKAIGYHYHFLIYLKEFFMKSEYQYFVTYRYSKYLPPINDFLKIIFFRYYLINKSF